MMKRKIVRWLSVILVLGAVFVLVKGEVSLPMDLKSRLDRLTAGRTFNFMSWELDALVQKITYRLLSPHLAMDDKTQAQFVLDYLDKVRQARNLTADIEEVYADPEIENPESSSRDLQQDLRQLREVMDSEQPVAEAILEDQVSSVLRDGGFGPLISAFPPVRGLFTPLPYILVVSPREVIQSAYQQQLVTGLTAAEQDEIENQVKNLLPEYSAYTTSIGGLAAYPAMLLESSSIDWVVNVIAHEWVHHYLAFYPLGWQYLKSGEARTINETTASLIGDWAGHEIINRYYAPLLNRKKSLPNGLNISAEQHNESQAFDFRSEMHRTRLNVDRLLGEGKIVEAEWYMEFQRRYFVANGYRLRKLNQAYFAFHGAYADTRGASGSDPIGPAVRRFWMLTETPREFVRALAPVTTLAELEALVEYRVG